MKPWQEYSPEGVQNLAEEALNAAIKHIQDQLGVESGDLAGMYFAGNFERDINIILRGYIRAELRCGGLNVPLEN